MKRIKSDATYAPPGLEQPDDVPFDPSPSDALPFNDVIEQRFRQLFTLCVDPKDIVKALEAATAWVKVRSEQESSGGWGASLRGTMK